MEARSEAGSLSGRASSLSLPPLSEDGVGLRRLRVCLVASAVYVTVSGLLLLALGLALTFIVSPYRPLLAGPIRAIPYPWALSLLSGVVVAVAGPVSLLCLPRGPELLGTRSSIISALHVLALLAQITGSCFVFAYENYACVGYRKGISNVIASYNQSDSQSSEYLAYLDRMQSQMQCCGAHGFEDWAVTAVNGRYEVPKSCCHGKCRDRVIMRESRTVPPGVYATGCMEKIEFLLRTVKILVATFGLGFSLIHLVLIISSQVIISYIRRTHRIPSRSKLLTDLHRKK